MGLRPASSPAENGATAVLRRTISPEVRAERLEELVVTLAEANAQLQNALDSRVVIEQAKGVLAERFGLEVSEAFELLRRSARNNRMPLRELARLVVESGETPPQIGSLRPTIVQAR